MAGGVFYYTIAGRQVSNYHLSIATLLAYAGLGYYFTTRDKKFEPIDAQLLKLNSNERDFVKDYMEKHRPVPSSHPHHH